MSFKQNQVPRDEESQYRFLSQITYEIVFSCFFVKGGGRSVRGREFLKHHRPNSIFPQHKNFEKITIGEEKWRTGEMEGTINNLLLFLSYSPCCCCCFKILQTKKKTCLFLIFSFLLKLTGFWRTFLN